jgi:hypothetical protein
VEVDGKGLPAPPLTTPLSHLLETHMQTGPDDVFRLRQSPNTCPGGYSLHLYCKYENPDHTFSEFPHEYEDGATFAQAAGHAKKDGWLIHRNGLATCPKCAARLRRGEKPANPA